MRAVWKYCRQLIRCLWVQLLASSGWLRRAEKELRERGAIVTLTLHRVLNEESYRTTSSLPGIIVRERTFGELMRYVTDRYEAVGLSDVVPGGASRALRIAVTFDDGWADNYTDAFPILRACGVPATIFVCPEVIGQQQSFWPERAVALLRAADPNVSPEELSTVVQQLKQRTEEERNLFFQAFDEEIYKSASVNKSLKVDKTLTWNQIVEMENAGVCFGSHTNTHQILTKISLDEMREELLQSKATLERELGTPCEIFAYPNGDWSAEARQSVEEAGFVKAVTTERGPWETSSDHLSIPRSNVSESDLVGLDGRFWQSMFEYTVVWKAWRAARRVRTKQRQASPSKAKAYIEA